MKAHIDKCQVRSSPESVCAEHHSSRSACAVSDDMGDKHVIDVVDKSECTDDDLVLLARIGREPGPGLRMFSATFFSLSFPVNLFRGPSQVCNDQSQLGAFCHQGSKKNFSSLKFAIL